MGSVLVIDNDQALCELLASWECPRARQRNLKSRGDITRRKISLRLPPSAAHENTNKGQGVAESSQNRRRAEDRAVQRRHPVT